MNSDDQPQALVIRTATEAEKQEMAQQMQQQQSAPESLQGKPAPEFSLTDIEGNSYSLADLQGKVVVMNFWFIDCAPCVSEMPELNKLVKKYQGKKDVIFLGISPVDSKEDIEEFITDTPFDYKLVAASSQVAQDFGVSAFPTSLVIGKDGVVAAHHLGFMPGLTDMLSQEIDAAL